MVGKLFACALLGSCATATVSVADFKFNDCATEVTCDPAPTTLAAVKKCVEDHKDHCSEGNVSFVITSNPSRVADCSPDFKFDMLAEIEEGSTAATFSLENADITYKTFTTDLIAASCDEADLSFIGDSKAEDECSPATTPAYTAIIASTKITLDTTVGAETSAGSAGNKSVDPVLFLQSNKPTCTISGTPAPVLEANVVLPVSQKPPTITDPSSAASKVAAASIVATAAFALVASA